MNNICFEARGEQGRRGYARVHADAGERTLASAPAEDARGEGLHGLVEAAGFVEGPRCLGDGLGEVG